MPQGPLPGPPLSSQVMPPKTSFGISGRFQPLSPGIRWVIHVLLTLPPLNSSCPLFRSTCMPHPHCQRSIWTKIKFSRNKFFKNLIDLLFILIKKKFRADLLFLTSPRTSLKILLVHRLFTTVKTPRSVQHYFPFDSLILLSDVRWCAIPYRRCALLSNKSSFLLVLERKNLSLAILFKEIFRFLFFPYANNFF
jgi:hypothetical protein